MLSFVLGFKSLAYFKVMFHICWHSSELHMCIIEGFSTSQIHLLLCMTCYQGDGYRGDVIGFYVQSSCWNSDVCMSVFVWPVLQEVVAEGGVIGHSSGVTVCSLYAGFVVYVCICVACSPGGGCRGDVIGHCAVSMLGLQCMCISVWPVLQEEM